MKKIWIKLFSKSKYKSFKEERNKILAKRIYENKLEKELKKISLAIKEKEEITFLHSGHLGDIINSLPSIKEIAKNKKCKLFIKIQEGYLLEPSIKKLLPLLEKQDYIQEVKIYENEVIDVDLNLFRDFPISLNLDSVRWYFHITGIHGDMSNKYLHNIDEHHLKKKIVIIRSISRKNYLINYSFLKKYNDVIFIGLKNEYEDLKKEIPNLNFYECKDFLEMAQIINSCKIFIGNLSFGYTLAEGLKKPRLLESGLNFPLIYPNGKNAFDFYFQEHFESNFYKLYNETK
jgi:ADP-heptose:LPS heptosyltransferase|tara:strand:- start:894 stop:1760 length:867 start_codon:yes stop_codon:yes gene_type:complete